MSTLELEIQISNTEAFIAADPVDLTFQRDTYISDGAGGKRKSGAPATVLTETCRMIPRVAYTASRNVTQTTNGQLERPGFTLLGPPGLALQRKDYFVWKGDTWEIIAIDKTPAYQFKADVAIRKDV